MAAAKKRGKALKIIKLIRVLEQIHLLSPLNLYRLAAAIFRQGINLMMLLDFAGKAYCSKTAVTAEGQNHTYANLFIRSQRLSKAFSHSVELGKGQKVAFLCRNHLALIYSIFAASRLGADIYLLNADMSKLQFKRLVDQHDFDFLVYDAEVGDAVEQSSFKKKRLLSGHPELPSVMGMVKNRDYDRLVLPRTFMGKLILLTGGTTGAAKEAQHRLSLFNYLHPFAALISKLNLLSYRTAYIATPIYHGYGIAVLLVFLALGKNTVITKNFQAKEACKLIQEYQVEVMTVVPLMIHKVLDENPDAIRSLKCIASGGAELNPKLIEAVKTQIGPVLYNLYGTSETGLNTIATPEDLAYSSKTIGQAVDGVALHVLDHHGERLDDGEIGQFFIENKGAVSRSIHSWMATGDIGCRDSKGYYFLSGRTDEMIVSAGENVFPSDLANILFMHPLIEDLAVIGVEDQVFGQRLKAFVQLKRGKELTKEELQLWLKDKAARFQLPKEIIFVDQLPYTSLGKPDKKSLVYHPE